MKILILIVFAGMAAAEEDVIQKRLKEFRDPGSVFYHGRLWIGHPLILSGEGGITYNITHNDPSNNIAGHMLFGPTASLEYGINGYAARLGGTFGSFTMVGGLNGNISMTLSEVFKDNLGWYEKTKYYGLDATGNFSMFMARFGYRKGQDGPGNNDDQLIGQFGIGF